MALVTDGGEVLILDAIVDAWNDGVTLRLFQNDITPDSETEVGDLTTADFSGYAPISLGDWAAAATDANGKAFVTHPEEEFAHDGGGTANDVYGWYLTADDDSDELILVERFPGGVRAMDSDTDNIKINLTFRLSDPAG